MRARILKRAARLGFGACTPHAMLRTAVLAAGVLAAVMAAHPSYAAPAVPDARATPWARCGERAGTETPSPVETVDVWFPDPAEDAESRALEGLYTGFGAPASGGTGQSEFVVRSLADTGEGSLRAALAAATAAGGGLVSFAVGGDIVLDSGVRVPANTTVDGLAAPAPGVTLWGDRVGGGGGAVEIYESNVIVRGLRVRNAANDGIQIAPKSGRAIAGIVVDHCSVTNSRDGGIDVTGRNGLVVSDVTLSWNYIAGSGAICAKGTCGGGSLIKYGATRVSVHANFWDKNLRRNPSVNGALIDGGALTDLRGNVVRGYAESGVQVVNGARANVVGNVIEGAHPAFFRKALVYAADNRMRPIAADRGRQEAPFDVFEPLGPVTWEAVTTGAGAPARDDIDSFYVDVLTTYDAFKLAQVAPGVPLAAAKAARRSLSQSMARSLGPRGFTWRTSRPPVTSIDPRDRR